MEANINEHREQERTLKATLITAQKLADELKAHARLDDVQREINGLALKRKDVETSIEATVQTLRHMLDFVREQHGRDHDDRVLHALSA